MTKLTTIFEYLKEKAPLELAESWDNSGLLIRGQEEVEGILLTMDVTDAVVEEAIEKKCQLIVSHHPVIFRPLKSLDSSSFIGKLMKHDITVISMHTNLDKTDGGVNDVLAKAIGLSDIEYFAEIGRMGQLEEPLPMKEFAENVAKVLDTTVKYTLPEKMIKKVALIGGAAGEYWTDAKEAGADVYLSGEASHHHALDAMGEDLAILVGGHWNTERPVLYALSNDIKDHVKNVVVMVSEQDQDPYSYYMN
ncbi:MAG: Nif3-like dinuclear metal center hexameric protein [Eubacteriales bacterium]|nr:Nif3-like dinuclear metal center hexameric protein [Eubacteriales bacterium]